MSDYSAIYGYVRDLLNKTVEELPNSNTTLITETKTQVPIYLAKVPCLTTGTLKYDDVPASGDDDDKDLFDLAVAHVIAAKLQRGGISNSAASNSGAGAVLEEEVGPTRTKYAGLGSTKEILATTLTDWESKPGELLPLLSCVQDARKAGATKDTGGAFVGLAGYRRRQDKKCCNRFRGQR